MEEQVLSSDPTDNINLQGRKDELVQEINYYNHFRTPAILSTALLHQVLLIEGNDDEDALS